ncbi:hypothetical protein Bcav_0100 [Beutenbergia cavernae DSM 12333]|uniref:DUF4365 domain-containing protein n=1 Tax=Beutenbergia cavernae (strain ATCC BAA-8 / DSM 12333 / CCUG 43141 / JCM 11478 / NBRC 16432 / NCIMB 13614 / HKI 0122) TaxID=471853 RepID=C5BUZ1_BEUC1|nr:hypothetical protein [Beutenbergia cavernae]ACQ78365.1 hypothetical protein Bcav_0100 [Beutenbergia cavernae DSM 12333]
MSTETAAVAEIMRILSRCPHLEGVLASHDRVPLTDGHIDVYSSLSRANKDWLGRVNVQIKGRASRKGTAASFSLKREVLEAHLRNAGVLLLCVDVDQKRAKATPRYAALVPFEIRRILASAPEKQKSVAIPLRKLPRLPGAVERIVEVIRVGARQNPFATTDPRLFESIKHITISTAEEVDFNVPTRLRPGEGAFAVEVTTENGSQVPLDGEFEILPEDYVARERDVRVVAGNAAFDSFVVQRISSDQTCVALGEGLSIVIHEGGEGRGVDINITCPSNFVARKRAVEFMVGIFDNGEIALGDRTLTLGEVPASKGPDIEEIRGHLAFLCRLQEVFDKFQFDGALIDLEGMTERDIEHLDVLYRVFVEGVAPCNTSGESGRMLVNFGPWAVMLVAVRGHEPGTWRFIDPFDPASPQMLRWAAQNDRDVTIPVTAYDIVEPEHLPKVLNLRLDLIDAAYERIAHSESTVTIANQCVRDLLNCADSGGARQEEFLHGAARLNDWIIRRDGERDVHRLNQWQIAWRRHGLTDVDRTEIRRMKRASANSQDEMAVHQELACALLLGDREESEFLANQLTTAQRDVMEGWPIWELRRHLVRT